VHIINSLNTGGAETQLARLVVSENSSGLEHLVVPLLEGGAIADRVREVGALTDVLQVTGARNLVTSPFRLAVRLRELRPDVVQGWLLQGNLAASVGVILGHSSAPVMWNVRWTLYDVGSEKRSTRMLLRVSGGLARHPRCIIFNSQMAVSQHAALGYPSDRARVIPNGFDVGQFRPDPAAREAVRRELEIAPDAEVIGMVARYHPMKNHSMSLRAAAHIAERRPSAVFVYAGHGVDADNKELATLIRDLRLGGRVRLLGERQDVARLYASFDVYWMSSVARGISEGFPNVIAEAMACGVPCVATDVGDAAPIIGEAGRLVAPGDWLAFSEATIELLDAGPAMRRRIGEDARARITSDFSLDAVAGAYHDLYLEILADTRQRRAPTGS
jgi:glycosyltransferase involved in cell wall biosynthesis